MILEDIATGLTALVGMIALLGVLRLCILLAKKASAAYGRMISDKAVDKVL